MSLTNKQYKANIRSLTSNTYTPYTHANHPTESTGVLAGMGIGGRGRGGAANGFWSGE